MDDIYQTRFSAALLTGVFAGLVATLLSMVYYLGYKDITGFPLSGILNVSSLIFVINLIFLVIGCTYSFFIRFARKGEFQFITLFLLATIAAVFGALHAHRTDNVLVNHEFQQLLAGLALIIGVSAFLLIPVLFHSKKFVDNVL